jgi:lysine-specific demethylase/histidyl-hydroxylase NO66
MPRRRGQLPKIIETALSSDDYSTDSQASDSSDENAGPKRAHFDAEASSAVILQVNDPDKELTLNGRAIADSADDLDTQARRFFEWFIAPVTSEEFFAEYFEKRPLVIKRNRPDYYKGWYSSEDIRKLLREHNCKTGRDIDVTNYVDGVRQTFGMDGRATFDTVWRKHTNEGCSLRVLCPQEHSNTVSEMLGLLEEHWGLGAGANSYLTPAGAQGFAPHYDDVDVFLIQCEGAKKWRLHPPIADSDVLPRYCFVVSRSV